MYEYLQINFCLFFLSMLCLVLLKSAPSRLKFYVVIVALSVWLIPWGKFQVELPVALVQPFQEIKLKRHAYTQLETPHEGHVDALFLSGTSNKIKTKGPNNENIIGRPTQTSSSHGFLYKATSEVTLFWLLLCAFGLGILFFSANIYQYIRFLKSCQKSSAPLDHLKEQFSIIPKRASVKSLTNSSSAMTSGIIRPVIWLGEEIRDNQLIQSAITHESIHIRSYDFLWNWLLVFFARLFWWNPAVLYLVKQGKALIEFSCDEKSNRIVEGGRYASSLMRFILNNHNRPINSHALGMKGEFEHLDFLRVKSLMHEKTLRKLHVASILSIGVLGLTMSLGIAYDAVIKKLTINAQQVNSQIDRFAPSGPEVYEHQRPYLEMARLIYGGELDKAASLLPSMEQRLLNPDTPFTDKAMSFRLIGMYYGDLENHRELIRLGDTLKISDPELVKEREIARILAVSFIKTQQYAKAIKTIEASEAPFGGYRGHPSGLLKAQAMHLLGDYKESNVLLDTLINHQYSLHYNTFKNSILRLYGKNALLLNETEKVSWAKQELGQNAPDSFYTVRADAQSTTYEYFLRNSVNGIRISGFDDEAFPLIPLTSHAESVAPQRVLTKAIRLSELNKIEDAIKILKKQLGVLKHRHQKKDRSKLLEHLLVHQISSGRRSDAIETAQKLIYLESASRPILARALWLISIGSPLKSKDSISYFRQYLAMFDKPSITADHEAVKRYYCTDDCEAVLKRVDAFYQEQKVVPDIRIVNRMIGLYQRTGQKAKAAEYLKLRIEAFPRARNYTME